MIVCNIIANKILFTAPFKYKSKIKKKKPKPTNKQQKEILPQHNKSLLNPPNGTRKYFNEALIMKGQYLYSSEYKTKHLE